MSQHLKGVGGAPGIAIGRVFRYIVQHQASHQELSPEQALEQLEQAQAQAAERLNQIAEQQHEQGYKDEAGIFEFQAMMVEDPSINDEVEQQLRAGNSLDAAIDHAIAQIRSSIAALEDDYMRQRAADVDAIGNEIRRALYGGPSLSDVPAGSIIVAADLSPAETVELPKHVLGFATAYGGPSGHTAILARSRGIPAVVGLGASLLDIADQSEIILDGEESLVIAGPTAEEQTQYRTRQQEQQAAQQRRQALRDQPGSLADGHRVQLWANIGSPKDVNLALDNGAEGIGLFRTEFLFLDRSAPPSEEEQYQAYRSTLEAMQGKPVVIRTLDIGGDKAVEYLHLAPEANPFLGVRGIRLCMQLPELFNSQVRALLRAAPHGQLWVMIPMISTLADFRWAKQQFTQAAEQLNREQIEHTTDFKLGLMVETPAAAVIADLLAQEADFFSIGSNDLTQYTMAVDRGSTELAARYQHNDPAVLRMVELAAKAAKAANIPIGVCGDLGGVPELAVVLAALGIDELSMAPALIPRVKEHLKTISLTQAQTQATQQLLH
jgi:phosphoenolpyruvate-protein phosphotransferase